MKETDWRRSPVPVLLILAGLGVAAWGGWLLYTHFSVSEQQTIAIRQGERTAEQVEDGVRAFARIVDSDEVETLAARAFGSGAHRDALRRYVESRRSELRDLVLIDADRIAPDPTVHGPSPFAVVDMMMTARVEGSAPVQVLPDATGEPALAGLAAVRDGEELIGYLLVTTDPAPVLDRFVPPGPPVGPFIALEQNNGRQPATRLRVVGEGDAFGAHRIPVANSLLEVVVPGLGVDPGAQVNRVLLIVLGLLMFLLGLRLRATGRMGAAPEPSLSELADEAPDEDDRPRGSDEGGMEIEWLDEPEDRDRKERPAREPVAETDVEADREPEPDYTHRDGIKLQPEIFRAYDIRGVIGRTLDAGVAEKLGRVIGTLALERDAAPVVVGRDGRHSGPGLVAALIEGITESGCDAIDIGAVPTGVLYFSAVKLGSGSGVMVTGSHNPPSYNGFKMMIGGETLHGPAIRTLYERIVRGDVSSGRGRVREQNMIGDYRLRISSDIKLARPLSVVVDCGNGIGGVCGPEVLRDIGAKVYPLFDDVDGDFPNHHPDPSEPKNLADLVESVKLMEADLGLAFDGDADRLGVVTPAGDIIWADRLMMLFAMDVLERNPGGTILYDVKCTGKLAEVIREEGGEPLMWKTGHSLIKAKMKETGAPLGGEMSGHFFFAERWYGFDDGIYAAARLLEILAQSDHAPADILDALPSSVSTPEIKVDLKEEGRNHAFVEKFQETAEFEGAEVNTIDGVRADWPDGWGLVRASNTTPVLVLRFEADTERALKRIQANFMRAMLRVDPSLELPF